MQQPYNSIRVKFTFLLLFALLALPNAAFSQDSTPPSAPRLVAGNIGWGGGHWLHVLDAPTMSGQISWYALNDDVTYQVQLATDADFNGIVFDLDGVDQTWIAPNLPAGFYHFRVGATDSAGNDGPWSTTGTVQRVEDSEPPSVEILSPSAEQPPSGGDTVAIELEVTDDTVLRLALFTINGEYVGSLGLNGVDWKLVPSLGIPRIVVFDAPMPKKGKATSLEIVVTVTDIVGNATTTSTGVSSGDTTKGGKGGKGKGHNK